MHPMTDGTVDFRSALEEYLSGLKAMLDALPRDDLSAIAGALARAYAEGRHVFVIGNGGSAATASHMACDLQKTILGTPPRSDVRRFRITALTDNIPLLTAWGNDASYDAVFSEQLKNLANAGDVLIVITASGNSPNIVEAVKTARELGLHTIGFLGFEGGKVKDLLDQPVVVRSENYGFIEDTHLVLNHLLTAYFQQLVSR
jgi:D-sedoheptulose 7-phosphate isomerase